MRVSALVRFDEHIAAHTRPIRLYPPMRSSAIHQFSRRYPPSRSVSLSEGTTVKDPALRYQNEFVRRGITCHSEEHTVNVDDSH
jgi:hypothetical protein